VRALNALLVLAGLAVLAWAIATYVQVAQAQPHGPPAPPPLPAPSPQPAPPQPEPSPHPFMPLQQHPQQHDGLLLTTSRHYSTSDLSGVKCPWFVFAFGAVGVATAIAGGTALAGTALRSVVCVNLNVLLMCLVLTAQVGSGMGPVPGGVREPIECPASSTHSRAPHS